MRFAEAVDVAGGGEAGRTVVNRLAGQRVLDVGRAEGPLRLITITRRKQVEAQRAAAAAGST